MKKANIFINDQFAGVLCEIESGKSYRFDYDKNYTGDSVSLTMPLEKRSFFYDSFPPFFDGLLPEGIQLEALLKRKKIDSDDLFEQLVTVGHDLVGNVTVEESR